MLRNKIVATRIGDDNVFVAACWMTIYALFWTKYILPKIQIVHHLEMRKVMTLMSVRTFRRTVLFGETEFSGN